jgi:hypothetical protein
MAEQLRHVLALSPGDRLSYPVIQFEVPTGTARIDVEYSVESPGSRSIVDIGLCDPDGLRGWSGSARTSLFVAPHEATPGYLPGPLAPGVWQVVLGAYAVPDDGCTVEVLISLEATTAEWITGDLHAHTVHSDGQLTVPELCALARAHGLDFLALIDHNTVSQALEAPANTPLIVLKGTELTTYGGHANLYGIDRRIIDFRCHGAAEMRARLLQARELGALISINHPFVPDCGWHYGFDLQYDAIEIWNGPWHEGNARALAFWHERLVAGQRLIALGGSDFHQLPSEPVRLPVANRIWVTARSDLVLLEAIRHGHVMVTAGVDAPRVRFTVDDAQVGDTATVKGDQVQPAIAIEATERCLLRLISDRGVELHRELAGEYAIEPAVPADRRFYRIELWSAAEARRPLVVTNPIFLKP